MKFKNIIYCDFDGVLFDSVKEAYLLSRYAYYGIPVDQPIDKTEYDLFRSLRHFVVDSWNYYYVMKVVDEKLGKDHLVKPNYNEINISDLKSEYLQALNTHSDNQTDALNFEKAFLEKRTDWKNEDVDAYNSMSVPYKFFDKLKSLQPINNLYILSTKNEDAIYDLLQCNDFNLGRDKIIGKIKLKKYGRSKYQFLSEVTKKCNETVYIIDDSKEILQKCEKIGTINLIPALWGYNDELVYNDTKNREKCMDSAFSLLSDKINV